MQLSPADLRRLRLQAQSLSGPLLATPAAVVGQLVGVQAQEELAARLAIRVRSAGLTATAVEKARIEQRELVHTWAMRGTLHFVSVADLGWLLGMLGPLFVSQGRRRRVQLGIEGEMGRTAMAFIAAILAEEGPLTREELRARLAAQGIPYEGQAAYHLIGRAALEGILCIGAPRRGQTTYVRLSDWVGVEPQLHEDARASLARRYLAGYGPAGVEEFASWSGFPRREARAAFQGLQYGLLEARVGEGVVWMLPEQAAGLEKAETNEPQVRLLPGYDPYVLGYGQRNLIIAPEFARRLHPGGGVIRPAVLVDGVVWGTWRLARRAKSETAHVYVEPFERLEVEVLSGIAGEVADIGRFLEIETTLEVGAAS